MKFVVIRIIASRTLDSRCVPIPPRIIAMRRALHPASSIVVAAVFGGGRGTSASKREKRTHRAGQKQQARVTIFAQACEVLSSWVYVSSAFPVRASHLSRANTRLIDDDDDQVTDVISVPGRKSSCACARERDVAVKEHAFAGACFSLISLRGERNTRT